MGSRRGATPMARIVGTVVTAILLAGCQPGSMGTEAIAPNPADRVAPVDLRPRTATAPSDPALASVLMAIEPAALARAVDQYRINTRKAPPAILSAGADLNGDGVAEALVYMEGPDYCAKTGCTLVVFDRQGQGYRVFKAIERVRLPVWVGADGAEGWRDLVVRTGGGGLAIGRALLRFGPQGYPGNATTVAVLPDDVPDTGEQVFADGAQPQALPAVASAPPPRGLNRPTAQTAE